MCSCRPRLQTAFSCGTCCAHAQVCTQRPARWCIPLDVPNGSCQAWIIQIEGLEIEDLLAFLTADLSLTHGHAHAGSKKLCLDGSHAFGDWRLTELNVQPALKSLKLQ